LPTVKFVNTNLQNLFRVEEDGLNAVLAAKLFEELSMEDDQRNATNQDLQDSAVSNGKTSLS